MATSELNVVTGAFGYTGKYITRRLLAMGKQVKSLTGHPDRANPFGDQVQVEPFAFEHPDQLVESLRGATTLYNTYWVRFAYGQATYDHAVANTKILFQAARDAGVRRIVHVSITNPSETSPLPYFKGKAILEKTLMQSGLGYAIIRPTVIFGAEDILINNITWILKHFPLFAMMGTGEYRLQPIYVEDMADLVVSAGQTDVNQIVDAVGPDVFTFDELVRLIGDKVGSTARIVHPPPGLALFLSRLVGLLVGDVVLTQDEVDGLMANLLISDKPPTGKTRLGDWLSQNARGVGSRYASELNRHYL